jgi:hypothetical protein
MHPLWPTSQVASSVPAAAAPLASWLNHLLSIFFKKKEALNLGMICSWCVGDLIPSLDQCTCCGRFVVALYSWGFERWGWSS